jgi:tetratricopeptide (TPR) repeat protein
VSNRCLRRLAAFVAIAYLGIPARSQSTEISTTVKGELHSQAPVSFHDLYVELAVLGQERDVRRVDVQFDGTFQLRDILSGSYTLRVTTLQGELVHQELVTVAPQAAILTVRLPAPAAKPSAPGVISLTQLRHPPARKAFQAVVSAQRFSESGQTEKAVEELEKAIRISPEYADAYNNLAVQHMRMRRFEEACRELARAIAIAGPNPMQLSNLAYAQHQLNRLPEAIAAARAALRLDSGWPQAHLILGSILAQDPRTRAESIPHLERAAETLPSARATLQRLRGAPPDLQR